MRSVSSGVGPSVGVAVAVTVGDAVAVGVGEGEGEGVGVGVAVGDGAMVGLAVGVGDDMGRPTDPPVPNGRGPTVWVMGQMRMSNRATITMAPDKRLRKDDAVFCMSVSIARTEPNGERESVEVILQAGDQTDVAHPPIRPLSPQ